MSDRPPSTPATVTRADARETTAHIILKAWLDSLEATAGPLRRDPGMEYGATRAWWGARKPRPRPHEGIDLRFASDERVHVPAIDADGGVVVALMDDFLGRTAIVERKATDRDGLHLYWVYAHMELAQNVQVGALLHPGQVIGRAALSAKACPSHVHVSLLEAASPPESWEHIRWGNIHDCTELEFLPLDIHGSSNANNRCTDGSNGPPDAILQQLRQLVLHDENIIISLLMGCGTSGMVAGGGRKGIAVATSRAFELMRRGMLPKLPW